MLLPSLRTKKDNNAVAAAIFAVGGSARVAEEVGRPFATISSSSSPSPNLKDSV